MIVVDVVRLNETTERNEKHLTGYERVIGEPFDDVQHVGAVDYVVLIFFGAIKRTRKPLG